jgi:hypothetical protein
MFAPITLYPVRIAGQVQLGRGDSSRVRSKESPPWVCEKCARKHKSSMG